MTIGEFINLLGAIATLSGLFFVWKKLKPDIKKTEAEALHEDASAAEVFQKMAIEEALAKSKTVESMRSTINQLVADLSNANATISKLTADLSIEQAARRDLEATVVRLNNELAEVKKERLIALAALESLKVWGEKFMAWAEKSKLVSQLKELGIIPIPFNVE